ncbi:MAG: aminotransferase class III-fold pyridoxal phosphate-dependent enzyme, partial [Rubrivivax sp.]
MKDQNDLLLARRQQVLGKETPLFYDKPLQLVRGEGVWVYDEAGRPYLDVYNNVPHVGHCHPHVVEALCRQARTLNLHTRYLSENVVRYGERLTATFDKALNVALFVCTGSEANELALRIARHHTGATGLIVTDHNYHGNTATLAAAATGIRAPESAPNVRTIHVPDLYREAAGRSEAALRKEALADVERAIDELQREGFGVSAILLDTLFSTEGLCQLPKGWLEGAVKRVRAAGGLYIADEVQPGFGRLGDHMWGHQAYDTVPDIATMGKPMGNGHPIGGAVVKRELADAFLHDAMYFNTFGGNPVSAAVGMAVLDVIEREKLIDNAATVGARVQQGLLALQQRHDIIGAVRGRGLFFGLDLVRDRRSKAPATAECGRLVNEMRRRGILISRIGPHDNVLKMRPPMVFSQANAALLLETLDDAL